MHHYCARPYYEPQSCPLRPWPSSPPLPSPLGNAPSVRCPRGERTVSRGGGESQDAAIRRPMSDSGGPHHRGRTSEGARPTSLPPGQLEGAPCPTAHSPTVLRAPGETTSPPLLPSPLGNAQGAPSVCCPRGEGTVRRGGGESQDAAIRRPMSDSGGPHHRGRTSGGARPNSSPPGQLEDAPPDRPSARAPTVLRAPGETTSSPVLPSPGAPSAYCPQVQRTVSRVGRLMQGAAGQG